MAKQRPVDKPCVDCGVLMVGVSPNLQRCPECIENRNRKLRAQQRERSRRYEMKRGHGTPISNPNAKYCEGCDYWYCDNNVKCCNYIFEEDRRRPCPPGKGCTVRKTKKKGRKQ